MQCLHDALNAGFVQIGVHGQADDFLRHGIAHRQFCGGVGHGRLLVEWDGVVHGGGDTLLLQLGLHVGSVRHLDGVLRPGASVVGFDVRRIRQQCGVAGGDLLALLYFLVEYSQFGQQNGRLQGVQATVDAYADVMIATILAVAGDLAHHGGQLIVVGEDGSAVAVAAQGFAGEETGASNGCEVAAFAAFVRGAKALRSVFNDRDAMLSGNGIDGVVVGTLAVQTDGDDGLGTRSDRSFEQRGIKVVGTWIHIHIYGLGSQNGHCFGGGNVGKARSDDFITWANTQRHLGNLQGVGAVGDGDAVFGTGIGGQFFFQFSDFGAKDVLAVGQHGLDVGINFGLEALVLGFEVDKIHGFTRWFWSAYCR